MEWSVTILVSCKPNILDPAAQQVLKAIRGPIGLGIETVTGLQMNKQFVLTVQGPEKREEVQAIAEKIGKDLLASFALEDAKVVEIRPLENGAEKVSERGL